MANSAALAEAVPAIRFGNLWWVAAALAVMIAAIRSDDFWFLDFVHVFTAVLWTGIDLFMGFVIGPVMRSLDVEARRAFIIRLMPRMIFLMPTLSIVATTSGWYLAVMRGYLDLPFPQMWWLIAVLAIAAILTVQGLGLLLPTNLRVYLEMRRQQPDMARVGRLMRFYVRVVASQGLFQLAIVAIMARFVTGL